MKQLSCRAMGVDCDFVAVGESDQEVVDAMNKHHRNDHPDSWAEMQQMSREEKDKIMSDMRQKIEVAEEL